MAADSSLLIKTLFLCNFFFISQSINFSFHGFNDTNLQLDEAATVQNSLVRLTDSSRNVIGHAFYPTQFPMFNSTLNRSNSFTTNFVFQINRPRSNDGGYGLAFVLSPSPQLPGAATAHYMGVFNESNNGSSSNHVFMVEFDTVNGYEEGTNYDGNHVGINLNGMNSLYRGNSEPAFQKGTPIKASIEYDGIKKQVNVTVVALSNHSNDNPVEPILMSTTIIVHNLQV